jgi:DedD protein
MMERALKERIIGAAVLVLVVVLVVPVFLDGPPGEGEIVSERVPLPGQSEQENKTVVLDRDRTEPVPASQLAESTAKSQPIVTQPEANPAEATPAEATPAEATPAPEPVAEEPPTDEEEQGEPAATSSTGMWAVQLGSFANQENAEALAAKLRTQGHAAFLSQVMTSDGQRHRVRIGPQKDRAAAEAVAASLKKAGHNGRVLPHP